MRGSVLEGGMTSRYPYLALEPVILLCSAVCVRCGRDHKIFLCWKIFADK